MAYSENPRSSDRASIAFPLGAALFVLIGVGVATFFLVRNDTVTEVQVGAPDDEAKLEEPVGNTDTGDSSEPAESVDVPVATTIGPASYGGGDFAVEGGFGDGPSSIVHTAEGFGALHRTADGFVARRSPDGLTWTDTPTAGLPDSPSAWPRGLVAGGDGFVAIFEEYPQYAEEEEFEPFFFEGGPSHTYHLATSADLIEWSTSELPTIDVESEYGVSVNMVDFAATGSEIAALFSVYENPPNEMRLLFDAGVITEADLDSYCGLSWESFDAGEPVIIYTCDHSAEEAFYEDLEERLSAAETDEERAEIESQFEENFAEPERIELAQVEPGTDLYAELSKAYQGEETINANTRVVAGPIGGPYSITELGATGDASGIVATGDGYVAILNDWQRSTSHVVRSADGVSWSEPAILGAEEGIHQLGASGQFVVTSGNDRQGRPLVYTSTDGGLTWASTPFGDSLYGAWANPVSGPTGIAVWVEGATEAYPEYPEQNLIVDKDGYVLELVFEENLVTLTAPDGSLVYELLGVDRTMGGEHPSVTRPDGGPTTVFLDPDTGEDLVSFTDEDFDRAYEPIEAEEEFAEPPRVREIWFSSDGSAWVQLDAPDVVDQNSYMQLAAVGDDEVLLNVTTWIEPPPELFAFGEDGGEPTEAEQAAIEEWFAENDGGNQIEWIRIPIN